MYTDVDGPTTVPFKDSAYNNDNDQNEKFVTGTVQPASAVVNMEGMVVNWVVIMGRRDDTASSSFPRTSAVGVKTINPTDRGITQADFDTSVTNPLDDTNTNGRIDVDELPEDTANILSTLGITQQELLQYVRRSRSFRNIERYPLRWNYEAGGSLGGASGTYRCVSASATTCSVQNSGSHFFFTGPWSFRPLRANSGVRVEDSAYMHFGWWSRQDITDGSWSFLTFHGDGDLDDNNTSLVALAEIIGANDVSGTATYQGPAVGYYAIYQPLGGQSGHGEFSATANLTADFGTAPTENGTVHGTIDQFSGHSDWSLTLNRDDIDGGNNGGAGAANEADGVSWTIGDRTTDGGSWEANFYSNLVEDNPATSATENARQGVVPSGIAGKFQAEFSDTSGADIGRMMGAFGAHCRTGC